MPQISMAERDEAVTGARTMYVLYRRRDRGVEMWGVYPTREAAQNVVIGITDPSQGEASRTVGSWKVDLIPVEHWRLRTKAGEWNIVAAPFRSEAE